MHSEKQERRNISELHTVLSYHDYMMTHAEEVLGLVASGDIEIHNGKQRAKVLKHLIELAEANVLSARDVIMYETNMGLTSNARRAISAKIEVELFKSASARMFKDIVYAERVRLWRESTPWWRRMFSAKPKREKDLDLSHRPADTGTVATND